jgi:hypothetical protein
LVIPTVNDAIGSGGDYVHDVRLSRVILLVIWCAWARASVQKIAIHRETLAALGNFLPLACAFEPYSLRSEQSSNITGAVVMPCRASKYPRWRATFDCANLLPLRQIRIAVYSHQNMSKGIGSAHLQTTNRFGFDDRGEMT